MVTQDDVVVKYITIEQIKDVAREDRAESHEPPILAQSVNPESLGDNRGEHTKQESVTETRKAGNEAKQVRVRDVDGGHLSHGEDETCENKTPYTAGTQHFDQKVGANTYDYLQCQGLTRTDEMKTHR